MNFLQNYQTFRCIFCFFILKSTLGDNFDAEKLSKCNSYIFFPFICTPTLKDVRKPLSKYQTKSKKKEAMIKPINVYFLLFKYLSELFETLSTPRPRLYEINVKSNFPGFDYSCQNILFKVIYDAFQI